MARLAAPLTPSAATLGELRAALDATLLAGGETAPIRDRIAQIERDRSARAASDQQVANAAAAALLVSADAAVTARVSASNTALAARLAALEPPPPPNYGAAR